MIFPGNEKLEDKGRIAELVRLGVHDVNGDEILQEFVDKCAEEIGLPISLVSVVLDGAQIFAASHGLSGWMDGSHGIPVEWSFCANSVASGKPFIVPNAQEHPETKDNPMVSQEGIRCYAGAPLVTKNGYVIGNFCVVGHESREFSQEEIDRLKAYAQKAVDRLEARAQG